MAEAGDGDTTILSDSASGNDLDSDFKTITVDESSDDVPDTTITEPQSHAILGTGGRKQSAFEISSNFSSTVEGNTALLLQPPAATVIDDETEELRKIRAAWLIVFGSVTSIFCFPFGVFGLIFAVYAWLLETSKTNSDPRCPPWSSSSKSDGLSTADRRRASADQCAKLSLYISLTGVAVGVIVGAVFISLGLAWSA